MQHVRNALAGSLPARPEPTAARAAAVAAILRERDGLLEVLFIRRAEREGDPWSGHMAFPGGRREPLDADLLATAIRETDEEIGVDLHRCAELVGVLDDQEAMGRGSLMALPTRPFVFELVGGAAMTFSAEVTDAVWAPVDALDDGSRRTSVSIVHRGEPYTLPGWDVEGRIVWGLTYRMLSSLLASIARSPA